MYRLLLEQGVSSDAAAQKLPPPTLPDDLSARQQRERLEQLGGNRYPFDRLTRKSVVAPQIIRVPDRPAEGSDAPLRDVDVWFVVYADFELISDPEFLATILEPMQNGGEAHALTDAELQQRGITIAEDDAQHESFGYVVSTLLDRVRLTITGRSYWTKTDESVLAAVIADPRFHGDREFPNSWTLLEGDADDELPAPAAPYEGLGFYAKVTKLKEPQGALFVEFHLAFAEPVEWFRGTNQLGSKLPAVMQSQVRSTRRDMMRRSQDD